MMKKTQKSTPLPVAVAALVLILLGSGCKGEEIPEPAPTLTFHEVVQSAGVPVTPTTYETVDTLTSANPQQIIEDEIWACKRFEVDLSQNADDFILYSNNNTEIIYPGNFLQGETVLAGAPRNIPLKRGAGTITINTLNGSNTVTKKVDEVSFGSIAQATNDLIGANNGNLTANITYTREEVRSLDEVGVKMNANFSNLTTKIKGSFHYNSSAEFNSVFVKVTQSLYTIVFEIPDPEAAFAQDVSPQDLQKYVFAGNPATYISSVNYGRIFYLLVQSTETTEDIRLAVEASFNGAVANGGGGVDVSKVSNLEQVNVSGYAYGGDANLAAGALIGDMKDVKTFIEKGGAINNGAPISYAVRSLDDPSRLVAANLATKYTVEECENVTGGLPVFTDARQRVGAACFTVGNSVRKMTLFDGISNEFVTVHPDKSQAFGGPFGLWQWGNDHTHPFRNIGVGAALHIRSDSDPKKTYHFNKAGTKFVTYRPANAKFSAPLELWQWGTDYSCPFDSVGAAMDVSVGLREIACLFNYQGTQYTLFESGQFSTPRNINDFQVRDRDDPVTIPFTGVGAALRLYILNTDGSESERVVMGIFDKEGKKYVYYDMDKNVIVGPLSM